jgi:hypothetical protein
LALATTNPLNPCFRFQKSHSKLKIKVFYGNLFRNIKHLPWSDPDQPVTFQIGASYFSWGIAVCWIVFCSLAQ